MIFTTVEFYTSDYLMGRQAVIDTALFPFYARKATQVIKQYTFDNIDENKPILDAVQMCCCEVAEYLYTDEQQSKNQSNGILSEKVGEFSITYESSKSKDDYKKSVIKGIIYTWLADTGYLYRGMC